jgi:hypothetical protein
VIGPGVDFLTVSGNNAGRIFDISEGAVVSIGRMKLRDGRVEATGSIFVNGGAIRVQRSTLSLAELEISDNVALSFEGTPGYGGAIYADGNSTVTLENVDVHDNSSNWDAIHADPAIVTVRNCFIHNNVGNGISAGTLNMQDSTVFSNAGIGVTAFASTIANSRFIGNRRGVSGGDATSNMVIQHCFIADNSPDAGITTVGVAAVIDTLISGNARVGRGGGISNTGTLYLINSAVIGNLATQSGGGILSTTGHLFLTNSTVSGNTAGSTGAQGMGGGGIENLYNVANKGGRITMVNSTIANNSATGGGGGLANDAGGIATIGNTIISGNNSTGTPFGDVSGQFQSLGTNLIGNSAGSDGWSPSDFLNKNPLLAPLGNNGRDTFTHALLPGSPARDVGNNAIAIDPQTMLTLATDQRGFDRFIGGNGGVVDIGAYETSYSPLPVTVSGRLTSFKGRGVDRALIKIVDTATQAVSYSVSNNLGYYRQPNLSPGRTYSISISHKSYTFDSYQNFTADQSRSDLNFIAHL